MVVWAVDERLGVVVVSAVVSGGAGTSRVGADSSGGILGAIDVEV